MIETPPPSCLEHHFTATQTQTESLKVKVVSGSFVHSGSFAQSEWNFMSADSAPCPPPSRISCTSNQQSNMFRGTFDSTLILFNVEDAMGHLENSSVKEVLVSGWTISWANKTLVKRVAWGLMGFQASRILNQVTGRKNQRNFLSLLRIFLSIVRWEILEWFQIHKPQTYAI